MESKLNILIFATVLLSLGVIGLLLQIHTEKQTPSLQGITVGQEYKSTTTPVGAGITTICTATSTRHAATLGSVIVTKTGTTDTLLYNATTSDVNKRTGNTPTSTLEQINIPASIAAGTYQFDMTWDKGILVVYGANSASTTITCRNN